VTYKSTNRFRVLTSLLQTPTSLHTKLGAVVHPAEAQMCDTRNRVKFTILWDGNLILILSLKDKILNLWN